MKKIYITFGQQHTHRVHGKTFDCDSVAVINCENEKDGRELAFMYFGPKWCFAYIEENFDMNDMTFYPRGLIEVNPPITTEQAEE